MCAVGPARCRRPAWGRKDRNVANPGIAILHYSCPPVIGGVEFIIEAHALEFARAGYPVRLIVGKGETVDPRVRTVTIPEVGSKGGPVSGTLRSISRGRVPPSFETAVGRLAQKLRRALRGVDVCMIHNVMTVHFNLVLTAALARIMAGRGRTRFIGWTHDMTFMEPVYEAHQHDRYPWNLLSSPVPGCDYCAISSQRQTQLARLFGIPASRVPVIPDGIDVPRHLGLTPRVEALFRDEQLPRIEVVALTPTRILRRKNLGLGIEIVAAAKQQGTSVRWLITGAPDPHNPEAMNYFHELLALRRRFRLGKDVIFLSERSTARVSNEDLRSLYGVADVLLFPSDREGFGLPVLEAGLFGLLPVLRDIPALREVGGRDAVYIRRQDSPATVASRLVRAVAQRPTLRCRKRVVSRYSWHAVFGDRILPAVLSPESVWSS